MTAADQPEILRSEQRGDRIERDLVSGRSTPSYEVVAVRHTDGHISTTCSCPQGTFGTGDRDCRHARAVRAHIIDRHTSIDEDTQQKRWQFSVLDRTTL